MAIDVAERSALRSVFCLHFFFELGITTMQKILFRQLPFGAPTEHYADTIVLF